MTAGSPGEDNTNTSVNTVDTVDTINTIDKKVETNITYTPKEINVDEVPVGNIPQIGISEETGEELSEELPEDISLESFQPLLNSLINVPGLYFGTWWIRTPEQTDIFAKELYVYCQKKGINIREYMFEELPLLLVGAQLAGGIYSDYKLQKPKKEKEKDVDKDRLAGEKEEEVEE